MAIRKRKRENLLVQATAYHRRVLIRASNVIFQGEEISELFAGSRLGSGWSLYFDESPVLQFNAAGLLRRLFLDGTIYLASSGRLLRFELPGTGGAMRAQRVPIDGREENELLAELSDVMIQTRQGLLECQNGPELLGSFPSDAVLEEFLQWLAKFPDAVGIADLPHALG